MAMAFAVTTARIRTRARSMRPSTAALALVALVPYLLGWTARIIVGLLWAIVAHLGAAVVVGWQAGSRRPDGGT